jgi:hypothetical protein
LPKPPSTAARLVVVSPDDVYDAVRRWRRDHIQQAYIDHANNLVAPVSQFSDEGRRLSQTLYALQRSAWNELSDFDNLYAAALNSQGLTVSAGHPIIAKTRHWFGPAWHDAERRIAEFRRGEFGNWPEEEETPPSAAAPNDTPVATKPATTDPAALRLGQLLDRYIERERPNEDRRLKTYIRRLCEFLGDPPIGDITTSDMDRFLVQLRRFPRTKRPDVEKMSFSKVIAAYATDDKTPRLTDKTIWANWFVFYKRLFRFAQDRDWIAHNPVSAAMPKKPRKRALEFDVFCELECGGDTYILQGRPCDVEDKELFAAQIRALAVLHRAEAATFVAESWSASAGWTEAPSRDPNRTEGVMILIQTPFVRGTTTMRTERDAAGRFTGLTLLSSAVTTEAETHGRFAQLLAPRALQNNPQVREACKAFLQEHPVKDVPYAALPGLGGLMWGHA